MSLDFIDHLWGSAILSSWRRWSTAVDFVQSQPNGEEAFKNFERLARAIEGRRVAASEP